MPRSASFDRPVAGRPASARSVRSRAPRPFAIRDLPLDGQGPLYDQIYRAVRDAILSGRVAAGTRLPTTRALAAELSISRGTVVAAFAPLAAEGYVVSQVGAGTFVAAQISTRIHPATPRGPLRSSVRGRGAAAPPLAPPPRLSRMGRALLASSPRSLYDEDARRAPLPFDFRPCVPDLERLSYDGWRRSLARSAWAVPPASFDYGDPAGLPGLRQEIAAYLGRARGISCRADEIVIVGGLAQALDLATRLFVDPGDRVLLEDPHYLGARRAFEAAGARLVAAPVDAEGIDLSGIPVGRLERCRLAYVTPSHQFPTGVVMSLARRQALLAWARRANAFVLEDDYDSEFRYAGRAIAALKSLDAEQRVLYVGTFSKTLLPGLRIAYVVVPPGLVDAFRSAKWLADWSSPAFEQAALERFLASGDFERHLRRARTCYAASRAALLEAIDRELAPFSPVRHDSRAGLHLLLELPELPGDRPFDWVRAGRRRGIGLYPVAPCHLEGAPAALGFVMGFARLGPAEIARGVRELGRLLAAGIGDAR